MFGFYYLGYITSFIGIIHSATGISGSQTGNQSKDPRPTCCQIRKIPTIVRR